MRAPWLWIGLPLLAAGFLLLMGTTRRAARSAAAVALLLALAAWRLPIEQPVRLAGSWGFRIAANMQVLGRQLIITDAMRGLLVWLFLALALWLGGAGVARMEPTYPGLAMAVVAVLVAALAIRPFLYAALLIETAVLLSVPLLTPPGSVAGRGVLRFLTFQTLGMLFILFTGWMLVGTETGLPDSALAVRAGTLLGLGFVLLLGVFPFHSWMPMLTEEIHPYAAALVLLAITSVGGVFSLAFLEKYTWLRESATVGRALLTAGGVMVVIGGVLAAFQAHAGRALGYAVLFDQGLALFALGLGNVQGRLLFFALWPARIVAFALWALALSGLGRRRDGLAYRQLVGLGRGAAWLSAGAVVAPLILAGAPWFVGFSSRLALWGAAAEHGLLWLTLFLVGSGGLAAAAFRLLGALFSPGPETTDAEANDEKLWMAALLLTSLALGVLPQWWWPHLKQILAAFPHLGP